MYSTPRIAVATALLAVAPLLGASADYDGGGPRPPPNPPIRPPPPRRPAASAPAASASASPPAAPLSAALFEGTSSPPAEAAWKDAAEISGVRMGDEARRRGCTVTHVASWVRVGCKALMAARVDLLAGEKRDFSILRTGEGYQGEAMTAQFSMRPGDRRIIQWIAPDLWEDVWPGDNGDWMTDGARPIGPMYGMAVQVDWASGSEPLISMF